MKKILLTTFLLLFSWQCVCYAALGDIITSFGVPGFDPRGLAWDGTNLWHADAFTATIYKLNPTTGAVLSSFAAPSTNAYDLEIIGSDLWNIDISSREFYSVNSTVGPPWTLEFTKVFNDYTGLTYDGLNIWSSDPSAGGDIIVKMDMTGNVISSFSSPGPGSTGLAWDGTYLWNSDEVNDMIYKINPSTGATVDSFSLTMGGIPTGLTFDGQYLWSSNTGTGQIYQLDAGYAAPVGPTPAPPGVVSLLVMLSTLGGIGGLRRKLASMKK